MATKNKSSLEAKAEAKKTAAISKERLKRITQGRRHHLRTNHRVIKYGAKSFVRNTWLSVAAIAIMVVTLVVLSATLIAARAMDAAIAKIRDQVDVSIYLKQGATQDQIDRIVGRLVQLETVMEVDYTSPEEANKDSIQKIIEAGHITDEEYINSLYEAPNKLPWTLNIKLVKSLIGSKKDQIATAQALGLKKIGDVTTQPDNAQTRGKAAKIAHLIEVSEA